MKFPTFYFPFPFARPTVFWVSWALLVCSFSVALGQKKKTGGGPPPNTGDNTEISQSGDNNRFPSRQRATTKNDNLRVNKEAMKSKQRQVTKFHGNDLEKKRPEKVLEEQRTGKRVPPSSVDQSSYPDQREKAMHQAEKPHQAQHEFKGDIVVKKKSVLHGKHPSEIDHVGRKSELVDHTKYQGYRTKAFQRKEATMEAVNSEGSMQYGLREGDDFSLEKRKSMRQAKERQRFEYSGDLLPKISTPPASSTYSGDADAVDREGNMKQRQKETANYSGDLNLEDRANKRRDKDNEVHEYSGDINLEARDKTRRDKDNEIHEYSGDLNLEERDRKRREKQKEIAQNTGDIDMKEVIRKEREIRKKEKTISKYSGDILVKTLKARDNKIRMKAKKIANWQGDVVINKKRKGAHPSAAYRGGKIANSYKARERYRRKMIKKYGRNPGIETPNYQKRKDDKPTYDKEESKIWDVQKYRDSKTKE